MATKQKGTRLKVKPLSRPCMTFMEKVGEYDFETQQWSVGDVFPTEVVLRLQDDEQKRWLSIMLNVKALMDEHGLKCGNYRFSPGGAIEILGIRRK